MNGDTITVYSPKDGHTISVKRGALREAMQKGWMLWNTQPQSPPPAPLLSRLLERVGSNIESMAELPAQFSEEARQRFKEAKEKGDIKGMLAAIPQAEFSALKGIGAGIGSVTGPALLYRRFGDKEDIANLIGDMAMFFAPGGEEAGKPTWKPTEAAKASGLARRILEVIGADEPAFKAAAEKVEESAQKKLKSHAEKLAGAKEKYGEEVSVSETERVAQSRIEGRRTSFLRLKDKLSEQFTDNLDKAEKAERAQLDSRYEPFRKVLSKVQLDLGPLAEAVKKAKSDILKGSTTSIPIFNDIMGKITAMVEDDAGGLNPVPGENLRSADQFRGYISELGDRMFSPDLPGDVYRALKSVREFAKGEVRKAIVETMGKQGAEAYDKLNSDWADYETTWRDRNSGSPLVRMLETLRKPVAQRMGVPVYRSVADLLTAKSGERAMAMLARKRAFGADPQLAARVRWADKQFKTLPKPKAVAEAERPKLPQMPETEPPLSFGKFRDEALRREAERLNRLTGWDVAALGYALRELVSGRPPWGLTYPFGKRLIAHLLSRPDVRKWLANQYRGGGI